jgi:hypothetical protein
MKKDYWWGPLTGVAFVVIAIVGAVIGGEPPGADEGAVRAISAPRSSAVMRSTISDMQGTPSIGSGQRIATGQ